MKPNNWKIGIGISIIALAVVIGNYRVKKNELYIPQVEANKEEIVLKWMIFGEKSSNYQGVNARFNKELQQYYPGTTVEFDIIPIENYKERWDMKMATNEAVDLAWIGNDIFNYTEEVKKGSFIALDYLLSTYGQNLLSEIPSEIWKMQQREGKTYSVPLLGALYRKDYEIVLNKSYAASYNSLQELIRMNRESPYTTKECYKSIEAYLAYIDRQDLSHTGISYKTFSKIVDKGYEGIYGPESPFVIKIFDKKMTVYNKYELENYRDYFETMYEWYQKGYIRKDIEELLDPYKEDGKKFGSILFLQEYGEHGVVRDNVDTEYEIISIPIQNYKYIAYDSTRNAVAIPKTSKNPKRALEIINLLNSEEGAKLYQLLVNGFEGRHYVQLPNGQVRSVNDESGKPLYKLSHYALGNVFLDFENTEGEFEQIRTYNKKAIRSPLIGFELDTRMIVLEMKKIDLVVRQYRDKLISGTCENWEEVYQEFIEKMKQAGSEKVIEEIQRQIDLFTQINNTNIN
ncbi:hypothetical protein CS063_16245 [Sporanaerobium hydrogeniformans]|uniref:Uncharacterized protein n=1 Tax=Sporanaerobium hydrogeniformans TaxID=3072179 RepID=A0AC61D9B0_9FIRM|nr:ABC transporter substrate-binding protein [Sporanaerobium hydrogeniformans]PHV69340.1 hypothetical protein CS063_16245 [Sporanaerobium hydrogeniformans]